jgi:pimeloyl-ACP methyl ester carboxylesterase
MHGFPDSMHLYDRLIPELPKNQHIITFDFIGWGDSDKPKQHRYDFASLSADLDTVINYFELDKVVLVVHDASGIPGIEWALDHTKRTAGLVLLNTVYSPMPTLNPPDAIKVFSTHGIQRTVSIWATSLSDALWQKRYNEQIAKFISTKELREPFQKILGYQSLKIRHAFFGLNAVLQQSVQERAAKVPLLRHFKRPVLIAFGNDDLSLNAGVAKEFHNIFPNSQLNLVKNAGHFVQVDAPKRVAHLLTSFMKSNNLK